VFAPPLVDEAKELSCVGDLVCVSLADPLKDAEDLNILSTLEHRSGDEQPEECPPVARAKCAAIYRERPHARRIAEHLDDARI